MRHTHTRARARACSVTFFHVSKGVSCIGTVLQYLNIVSPHGTRSKRWRIDCPDLRTFFVPKLISLWSTESHTGRYEAMFSLFFSLFCVELFLFRLSVIVFACSVECVSLRERSKLLHIFECEYLVVFFTPLLLWYMIWNVVHARPCLRIVPRKLWYVHLKRMCCFPVWVVFLLLESSA